ncbi:MAG: phage terminase large subunit [Pseudomonadota bacterium]|nr:phage terminase large subunit [Pseudomonadota bacterium]MDE3038096.1 phage terminase large subunit [Pseudomonadota bacterium]
MSYWFDELLKRDLPSFIGKTLATADPAAAYLPNWHIDLIAEYLEAARKGEITRLIINLPPRCLKSICVSVAWPAWLLGHDPSRRIMVASYASSLSIKHSLDTRLVMTSDWYKRIFPATRLAHDQNEKHKFVTTQRGYRLATSVGGAATGEGGNFLIIDDPMNPAQAASHACRELVQSWFDHTFASRLDDKRKGVIVLVMQRLHTNDLTEYLLAKGGWEHLCLPAVATRRAAYDFGRIKKTREAGEALHQERENNTLIERAKIELGSAAFAAQYQQQPLAENGGAAKPEWFSRYSIVPPFQRVVQSWDTAIKSGARHAASACLTFAEYNGKSCLLDARAMRREYPDLKREFYALAEEWKPQAILVEDKASGQQLLQDARRETSLPVISMRPKHDKITRFAAVAPMLEAGRVQLPQQAPWLADFEDELFSFPNASHDDQVDALTQYLEWLRNSVWERLRIRRL